MYSLKPARIHVHPLVAFIIYVSFWFSLKCLNERKSHAGSLSYPLAALFLGVFATPGCIAINYIIPKFQCEYSITTHCIWTKCIKTSLYISYSVDYGVTMTFAARYTALASHSSQGFNDVDKPLDLQMHGNVI